MIDIKIKWFYTKVFFITGTITIATILAFGIVAGLNAVQIVKERQLNQNEEILSQLQLAFNEQVDNLSTLLIEIYASEKSHKLVSDLFNIYDKDHVFFTDPFYKKNINKIISDIFGKDNAKIVGFINKKDKIILIYNLSLESWEVFYEDTTLYHYLFKMILEDKNYKNLDLEKYFTGYINKNLIMIPKVLKIDNINNYIIVGYNDSFIKKIIEEYNKNIKGETFVFNNQGENIFSTDSQLCHLIINNFDKILIKHTKASIELGGYEYYITKLYDDDNKLYYFNLIYKSTMFYEYRKVINLIVWAIIISLIAIIFVYYFAVKIYGKRTQKIIKALEFVGENNLDYRITNENKNDEFNKIADKFNKMCDDLKGNIEKSYIAQIKEKTAELGQFQATVNPHFLYNTLESIRDCVVNGEKEYAEEMITSLATIFRSIVRKDTFLTIEEEIELCKMIIEMYNIRYYDAFQYQICIEDNILHFGIIKNLLQPLIENYFKHAIDFEKNNNQFIINGRKKDEYIEFEFIDNGYGIDEVKQEEIKETLSNNINFNDTHYGLANVNERIKMVFGKDCGIDLINKKGKGTEIKLRIKAMNLEELKNYIKAE